jgi:D-methionine transport system permease protein
MIPECVPSLISQITIAVTTILGYSAMSGIIGGGGLGKIAINYGYYRYKYLVMLLAVVLLIVMVQAFQSIGTRAAIRSDKRLRS